MRTTLVTGVLFLAIGLVSGQAIHAVIAASRGHLNAATSCPPGQPKPAGPVGSLTVDGITLTFWPVKGSKGTADTTPDKGKLFQIGEITIADHGKLSYRYSASDFSFLNAGARTYKIDNNSNLTQPISDGTLTPGTHVSGQIEAQVPAKDKPIAVSWAPDYIGSSDNPVLDQVILLPR